MHPLPSVVSFNQLLTSIARAKHHSTVITFVNQWTCETDLATNSLRKMEDENFVPIVASYNTIICSLCKDRLLTDALNFFSTMTSKEPDVVMHNSFIYCYCQQKKIDEAVKTFNMMVSKRIAKAINLFHEMLDKKMIPNVVIYTTLIELLHEMQACGEHPDLQTYAILFDSLLKNRHFVEAMALFREMVDKKLEIDIVIYNILIDAMCDAAKLVTAKELFCFLSTKGLQPNARTYTIMFNGLCREGLINEACDLLEKMDGNGCLPENFLYNTIIQGLLQHDETSRAVEYIEIMVDKGFSADETTATMVIELLCANKVDKTIKEWFEKLL
ncbi:hypothetical protein I3843_08G115600 [Carya illinoinensis]|nr:hypothetical protein I3843_08G115600 [Carya illinoinensis]